MIILVGPPGSLAPEVAAELSQLTGQEFADAQVAIDQLVGGTGPVSYTEERARSVEHDVAFAVLSELTPDENRILALGSGCLGNSREDADFADVRTLLARLNEAGASVVHLTASLKALSHRNGLDGPRLAAVTSPRRIFFTQMTARAPLYEQASSITIDTSDRTPSDVAEEVLGRVS